ncbi:MAG: phosphatase PAP2 family protein [Oceanospirillales bacterium]|uniref:undecaprenyl-diphosphate phosphatase n=1 Tax=Marinobacterium halophilum TaxID=267374 RepID=A0A2P8EWJ6_9GAMM|nr:phosphatase PAP2 family protein [Marinobacterium halophilum]MBR9827487.1 phosphatase PAP2 family protein [Oceanospirillales bacterium]PSL13841.1 undecaprenyl-diphosphatase [Marinobacterium halophilum]
MNRLQQLGAFDTRAFHWCNLHARSVPILTGSRWLSRLGDGSAYLLLGIGLAVWEETRGIDFLQAGLLAYAIELPLYRLLKNSIRRARPCHCIAGFQAAIEPADTFSFPSGHTAAAFVFAMLIAEFYPALIIPGFLLAALVGAARVMLGVHYPTDIAAGAVLGVATATLGLQLWALY